ncbi:hypothetical protein SprV_0100305700 [Sparganum proliferum]
MDKKSVDESSSAGHRLFYKLPDPPNFEVVDSSLYCIPSTATKSVSDTDDAENIPFESKAEFFKFIGESVIGAHKPFHGAFGDRMVVYCDYIASGRALSFIENFIYNEVLPHYGNTHTTTSITSLQTTLFRHEAKDIVRNAVRASDYDAVFFVGSGCTGAVHKLIHNLHIMKPPIVVVGPFEHHSNMLPWRHMAAKITRLKTDATGNVSLDHLKQVLEEESLLAQKQDCALIVCLAAASNVTGILLDVNVFSALVHRYGGLIFWDYATAAPYVDIDMNPVVTGPDRDYVYKDAIYFSMHKFVGGVQTPGVLVAKRVLFKAGETHPDGCGGGSVCFVRREAQVYLQDVEEREEGGTPAIVESIRAGLVMQLKQAITAEAITAREEDMVKRAWSRLKGVENLLILGGDKAPRLPIFSIVVRHSYPLVSGSGATPSNEAPQLSPDAAASNQPGKRCLFLHHAFVAALLNDLFGVQCRAGCACAGPYAMDLLGIDEALAKLYEGALVKSGAGTCRISRFFDASSREVLRPGFTRFSIPYFMSDEEADFVFEAVRFVATYGWAFLPLYTYEATTGEWHHRTYDAGEDRQWLGHIQYSKQGMVWRRGKGKPRGPLPKSYKECLMIANAELKKAIEFVKSAPVSPVPDDTASFDEDSQKLRWFLLPCEAAAQMRGEVGQLAVPTGPRSPWYPDAIGIRSTDDEREGEKTPVRALDPGNGQPTFKTNASLNAPSEPPVSSQLRLPTESTKIYSGGLSVDDGFTSLNPQTLTQMSQVDSSTCLRTKTISTLSAVNEPGFYVSASSGHVMDAEDEKQAEMLDEDELREVISNLNGLYMPPKPSKTQSLIRSLKSGHSLWKRPIKQLYKPFVMAIKKFDMIQPNDKILVCLSGGKDSLSLLHCMHEYQQVCNRRPDLPSFELGAVTVDPGSSAYNPRPLIAYMAELGVPYLYEEQSILRKAAELGDQCESVCSFCSRMKRGRIYAAALKNGYTAIALGQHLDDLAESLLLSCFHNGALNTMKANYTIRDHNLRVIRPLVFVREKVTRTFAEMAGLPIIQENCPACFQMPKERMRIKRVLTEYESIFPNLYSSLQAAMMPLLSRNAALGLSAFEDARRAIQADQTATPSGADIDSPNCTSCTEGHCKNTDDVDHQCLCREG